ncbi:type II toxin-antitoxin system Phd/YefM family antitoxin [Streptomyces sp. NPDC057565]|uniref:type II toxin-antitoxin system Phd/YefM family antitoxin n=1 Tax=Streptomyces sp. NPDC057565 TaxID=3346169 RepID=UPI0036911FB9
MEHIGVRELREQLGRRVDAAHFHQQQVVVEKNGEPRAVLVPYSWWQEQTGQSGSEAEAPEHS